MNPIRLVRLQSKYYTNNGKEKEKKRVNCLQEKCDKSQK